MYRLHLAHRITQSEKTLIPDLDSFLDRQAPVPMKSFQIPPMHAALHWSNWPGRLEEFSRANIRDSLLVTRTRKRGKAYRVVPRFLPGLEDLGLCKYPGYSKRERSFYHPK